MIVSGAGGAIDIIGDFIQRIEDVYGAGSVLTFQIIIGILAALTIMCGVAIIIGGFVMTTYRVEAGRNIVLVAVGTGVLGLLLSLIQAVLVGQFYLSWNVQIAQSIGWIGAIFAVEARIIAEQRPMTE